MTDAERQTWAGLANRVTLALPPAFIGLLLVNTVFIGAVFWLIQSAQATRAETINLILNRCLGAHP